MSNLIEKNRLVEVLICQRIQSSLKTPIEIEDASMYAAILTSMTDEHVEDLISKIGSQTHGLNVALRREEVIFNNTLNRRLVVLAFLLGYGTPGGANVILYFMHYLLKGATIDLQIPLFINEILKRGYWISESALHIIWEETKVDYLNSLGYELTGGNLIDIGECSRSIIE